MTGVSTTHARPLDHAEAYLAAGLSPIAIRADGTKAPTGAWAKFQRAQPTDQELSQMFLADNVGIAICLGAGSGDAELIDIDDASTFQPYCNELERQAPGLLAKLTINQTPRPGYHLVYRCPGEVQRNQKLAMRPATIEELAAKPEERVKVRIETRGQGGYALAPGGAAECHKSGQPYEHHSGPDLCNLPTISAGERATLLRVARMFSEVVETEPTEPKPQAPTHAGLSPGDDYNARGQWELILEPHGWNKAFAHGNVTHWTRPGKDQGTSATTGLRSKKDNELLCVFSTSAHPFPGADGGACSTHTKFGAYALLNHDGDFSAAAKALATEGYGDTHKPGMANQLPEDMRQHPGDNYEVTYQRITCRELAGGDYAVEYLIDGTMVAGQPLIIAGPQKVLKTSIIIDAAISLATAGHFLGRLGVGNAANVAVMSGDSGLATLQETARRIASAAGRELADIEGLIWTPDIPRFGEAKHLDALKRFLLDDEIGVLFIDPAYLCLPSQDSSNLMAQGELLRSMAELCRRMGVTMVLAHHTKKNTNTPANQPPELSDIAWAGFAEFARQWWLLGRRDKYEPGSGEHRLWLSVGGSAGHSALWGLDISEGVYSPDTDRRWEVSMRPGSEINREEIDRREKEKVNRTEKRKAEQLAADCKEVVRAMTRLKRAETKSVIRDAAQLSGVRVNAALYHLEAENQVQRTTVKRSNNQPYEGYELCLE